MRASKARIRELAMYWGVPFLVLGSLGVILTRSSKLIDDSFITMRYAKNLLDHGELVFNLGNKVEGISNFLWAILLAVTSWVSTIPVHLLAIPLTFLLLAYSSFMLYVIGRRAGLSPFATMTGTFLMFLNIHYLPAMTSGLEASLYGALLTSIAYHLQKRQYLGVGIAAGLLFFTRADAIGPICIVWGIAIGFGEGRKKAIIGSVVTLVMLLAMTVFRLAYYGDVLPNSVIAKSFNPLLLWSCMQLIVDYFWGYLVSNPLEVFVFVMVATQARMLKRQLLRKESDSHLAAFALASIGYSFIVVVRNGTDWMPHFRLLNLYSPLYAILWFYLIKRLSLKSLFLAGVFLVQAILLLSLIDFGELRQLDANRLSRKFYPQFTGLNADNVYGRVIIKLGSRLGPRNVVSAEMIGTPAYMLDDVFFHDPTGLMDKYLARHGRPSINYGKHDINYTLSKQADILIWHATGHISGAQINLVNRYTLFTPDSVIKRSSDSVMIRDDRLEDFAWAFSDWHSGKLINTQPEAGSEKGKLLLFPFSLHPAGGY